MPSAAITGDGTKLAMKATANAVAYTDIAEVFDVTPPNEMDDEIEVTHYGSGGTKEYIGGLTDPGEVTFQMNAIPGSAAELMILEAKAGKRPRGFRLTYPNGATTVFDLLIRGYEPAVPLNDRMTATVTGRVSGVVTRAGA